MPDYKQYYIIRTPPEDLYKALTIAETIQLWTGYPAGMKAEEGFEFSLFDGDINGKNLELKPGKEIVQQWYFDGQKEASIVRIILHPHKKGTSVELRHSNIPEEVFDEFRTGWDEYYFGRLQDFYS